MNKELIAAAMKGLGAPVRQEVLDLVDHVGPDGEDAFAAATADLLDRFDDLGREELYLTLGFCMAGMQGARLARWPEVSRPPGVRDEVAALAGLGNRDFFDETRRVAHERMNDLTDVEIRHMIDLVLARVVIRSGQPSSR